MFGKLVLFAFIFLISGILGGRISFFKRSLVIRSTNEDSKQANKDVEAAFDQINPSIYSMEITSNVTNRFATNLITSRVRNLNSSSAEASFSVVIPKSAFISDFIMEIGGKRYKAYVKEKEEAKKIFDEAVSRGESAAHVAVSPRESNTFTVAVNLEPLSKAVFLLTYEELLQRQYGYYDLVINIHPGQIVKDLKVQININETQPLRFVRTPSLRTGNEIGKNEKLNSDADIVIEGNNAVVRFNPDESRQGELAKALGGKERHGLSGQFIVQYDVERDSHGGEILIKDGYFVHFFAPQELKPIQKHIVFILDHSGSMDGRKLKQLIMAMNNILDELNEDDIFHIVSFDDLVSILDVENNHFVNVESDLITEAGVNFEKLNQLLSENKFPEPSSASADNIDKAKAALKATRKLGLTNIIGGLEVGLVLLKLKQKASNRTYEPIVVFLTDGLPNVGISNPDRIVNFTTQLNTAVNASIFSLSFGEGANKDFLRKLSLRNFGFSRHIYEAADAVLQLENFYKLISSPLLNNVTFKYVDQVQNMTKTHYPIYFDGTEIITAGKIPVNDASALMRSNILVTGNGVKGQWLEKPKIREENVTSLERLWAYLTVKQLLDKRDLDNNVKEIKEKALDLSLKYSFVTDVSSLVVVKPNKTTSVEPEHQPLQLNSELIIGANPAAGFRLFSSGISPRTGLGNINIMRMASSFTPMKKPLPTSTRPPTNNNNSNLTNTFNGQAYPLWLYNFLINNGTFINNEAPDTLKIGSPGLAYSKGNKCSNALNLQHSNDNNSTVDGMCSIIFDCPQIVLYLNDYTTYTKYSCKLVDYDGVCCPLEQH